MGKKEWKKKLFLALCVFVYVTKSECEGEKNWRIVMKRFLVRKHREINKNRLNIFRIVFRACSRGMRADKLHRSPKPFSIFPFSRIFWDEFKHLQFENTINYCFNGIFHHFLKKIGKNESNTQIIERKRKKSPTKSRLWWTWARSSRTTSKCLRCIKNAFIFNVRESF